MRVSIIFIVACSSLSLSSLAQQPTQTGFIIEGVRVEDGRGLVAETATVVVQGGKIVTVGTGPGPEGLPVVDGNGKVLYPGFIDAFSSRGLKLPALPAATSSQGQASPQVRPIRPGADTTAHGSMWEANRKGITPEWMASENLDFSPGEREHKAGVTLVALSSVRGSMRGQPAVVAALPATAANRVLVASLGQSFSFRIGSGTGYPTNVLGSIALMRQTLFDAQSLKEGSRLWAGDKKPEWAAALEGLQPALNGSARVFFEANQAREIRRALAIADEFGLELVIVGGREAGFLVKELSARRTPVVLTDDLGPEPTLEQTPGASPSDSPPAEHLQERHAQWARSARSAESLLAEGVAVAFSSEGGQRGLLAAVRARIARGMDRGRALEALTSGAAKILGLDGQTGAIAPGMRADLVLMSGDFASSESVVEKVWVGGAEVFPEVKK